MDYSDTTVVIAVKDEPAVESVVKEVFKALPGCCIIVIYKGSIHIKHKNAKLKVIKQTGSGKGVALAQVGKHIDTDITAFIDGDGTYDVRALRKVVQLVRSGAGMAIGNRFGKLGKDSMAGYIQLGNHVLTITGNLLYGMKLRDSQTGLRAIKSSIFKTLNLTEPHFGVETEMNIKVRKRGYNIEEIPINYYERVGETKHFKLVGGFKLFLVNFKFLKEQ